MVARERHFVLNGEDLVKREYGIDLLKIVAMIFIVAGHILYRGGAGLTSTAFCGAKGITYQLVNAFIICHVNIFVLCTGWLMCTREVHYRKLLNLWCEMVFYSLVFIGIAKCFFPAVPITTLTWASALFPIGFNPYWFITQYFLLMFMMPLLNCALRTMTKKSLCQLLGAGVVLLVLYPFVLRRDMFGLVDGFSAFWFAYLYLLAGTIKLHGVFRAIRSWKACCVLVISVLGAVVSLHLQDVLCRKVGVTPDAHMWGAYTSPFLVVEAVAMLLLFTRVQVNSIYAQKILRVIAPSVLAVYLIHSNGVFRQITNWNESWTVFFAHASTCKALFVITTFSLLIFAGCILIDLVRRYLLRVLMSRFTTHQAS